MRITKTSKYLQTQFIHIKKYFNKTKFQYHNPFYLNKKCIIVILQMDFQFFEMHFQKVEMNFQKFEMHFQI